MTYEWKYVFPERPKLGYSKEDLDIISAPFEVDGWKVRREDLTNFHNWYDRDQVRAVAFRYVK